MIRFLTKRILSGIMALFLFLTFMFFLTEIIIPHDFTTQFALSMNRTERERLQEELGLNLPLGERYLRWVNGLFHGSLGPSFYGTPVIERIKTLLPTTLLVFATGTAIAFMFGQWLGKVVAWRGPGLLSTSATFGAITLYTTFPPWMVFLVTYLLANRLGWSRAVYRHRSLSELLDRDVWQDFPLDPYRVIWYMLLTTLAAVLLMTVINWAVQRRLRRRIPPPLYIVLLLAGVYGSWFAFGFAPQAWNLLALAATLILTYVLLSFGETMLIMRTSMTDTLKEEYILTAQAKGLPEQVIRDKHAARNALLPVFSRLVISLPYLLTGLVIIEDVFRWPGMSGALFTSLYQQDMPMVMGALLLVGILTMVARLVLDVLHAYLDPRIRYQPGPLFDYSLLAPALALVLIFGLMAVSQWVPEGTGQKVVEALLPHVPVAIRVLLAIGLFYLAARLILPMSRGRWWQRVRQVFSANWRRFKTSWQVFAGNRLALMGLVLIVIFGILAASHPILRKTVWKTGMYDPVTGFDSKVMHPSKPSRTHLLGTDGLGRDVLSMLVAATRPAFVIGLAAAIATAILGTIVGVVSAYYGSTVDAILMHVSDAFLLLPAPLLMVILGMRFRELGPLLLGLIYGLISGLGGAAIVMRSYALGVVNKPFINAARVSGGGSRHIIFSHIVPHMLPLAALYMMLAVTGAVVADAFISFFGFSRDYLNWGSIIYSSIVYSSYLSAGTEWHVMIPPSVALSVFAAAFYLVSRGLHRVADPRLRAR